MVMLLSIPSGLATSIGSVSARSVMLQRTPPEMRGQVIATQSLFQNIGALIPTLLAGIAADLIVENAQAAGDLVTKLLEYAKAGAAGDQNVLEPVDLSAMLRHVVRRFTPTAERKGLWIHLNEAEDAADGVAGGELWVTDRLKLERVVANLVDNALKYTERGGVTIEWAPFGGGRSDEGFSVAVTDTGIGVPPEDVTRLESLQREVHAAFIDLVKSRRGARLKEDPDIFTGAFWSGGRAVGLGLADEVGDLRAVLRRRFGEAVTMKPIAAERGFFRRRLGLTRTHAAEALELGYDAVLLNTAIAKAADPVQMATAFRLAVEAGRAGFEAGLMGPRDFASPSTPVVGTPFWHAVS